MARHRSIVINRADRFIADTHLGHGMMVSDHRNERGEIIRKRFRDFDSIEAHDEHIVQMWNAVVAKTDTVYHLGDAFYWKLPVERMQQLFKRLNGRKHLLVGNHDTEASEGLGWESVLRGPVHFKDGATGRKIVASHHPQREWDGWHNGSVHIHGHTHNNLPSGRRSLDVGVDSIGYLPLTAADIFTHMELLPELDFTGVEVDPVVPGGNDDEATNEGGYGR